MKSTECISCVLRITKCVHSSEAGDFRLAKVETFDRMYTYSVESFPLHPILSQVVRKFRISEKFSTTTLLGFRYSFKSCLLKQNPEYLLVVAYSDARKN